SSASACRLNWLGNCPRRDRLQPSWVTFAGPHHRRRAHCVRNAAPRQGRCAKPKMCSAHSAPDCVQAGVRWPPLRAAALLHRARPFCTKSANSPGATVIADRTRHLIGERHIITTEKGIIVAIVAKDEKAGPYGPAPDRRLALYLSGFYVG